MKIVKKSQNKVWKIAAVVVVVLLLVAGAVAWSINRNSQDAATDSENASRQGGDTSGSTSEDPISKPSSPPVVDDSTGGVTDDPDIPSKSVEAPVIERSRQSGSVIKVVATLREPSDGNCEARFTKTSHTTVRRTTSVEVGPSYYVCSFSVPASSFSADGTWELVVIHKSESKVANSSISEVRVTR